jgi:hypothetical protein
MLLPYDPERKGARGSARGSTTILSIAYFKFLLKKLDLLSDDHEALR